MTKSQYASSGVDIDAGNRTVDLMKDAVKSTYNKSVLAGIGSFGGLFDVSALKGMKSPVLVASTDGVGTKVKLAASVGRYRGIGHDIVLTIDNKTDKMQLLNDYFQSVQDSYKSGKVLFQLLLQKQY